MPISRSIFTSFRYRIPAINVIMLLALLAGPVPAQESPREPTPEAQSNEARRLDDARAIAQLVFDRYRGSPAGTAEVSGKLSLLEGGSGLSAEDRRKIERNDLQTFRWQYENFRTKKYEIELRCSGRRGEIFLARFDTAGKLISCETDRNPSAKHYASDRYVLLFHVANSLRTEMPRRVVDRDAKRRVPTNGTEGAIVGMPAFEIRDRKREGEFVIARGNGTPWCRGQFAADLPTGTWQIYSPDGKPAERWTFNDGTISKTPTVPGAPFKYDGDLGANDFALTLVQGSPPPATGPPRTYIRVSAAGVCKAEFGIWKATFRLTDDMQRELRDLVRAIDVLALKQRYDDPHIHDGGWMTISLRTNGTEKTVRFVNWYPRPLRDLADFFAEDVLPQYPLDFLGAVPITDFLTRDAQIFLEDRQ